MRMQSGAGTSSYDAELPSREKREANMFKGGLLWLVGIPLPIILILWFLGYLS